VKVIKYLVKELNKEITIVCRRGEYRFKWTSSSGAEAEAIVSGNFEKVCIYIDDYEQCFTRSELIELEKTAR
jgi:hypothetical protein